MNSLKKNLKALKPKINLVDELGSYETRSKQDIINLDFDYFEVDMETGYSCCYCENNCNCKQPVYPRVKFYKYVK